MSPEPCPRAASTGLRCGAADPVQGEPCPACRAPFPPTCIHGPMLEVAPGIHECATCSFSALDPASPTGEKP